MCYKKNVCLVPYICCCFFYILLLIVWIPARSEIIAVYTNFNCHFSCCSLANVIRKFYIILFFFFCGTQSTWWTIWILLFIFTALVIIIPIKIWMEEWHIALGHVSPVFLFFSCSFPLFMLLNILAYFN